MKLLSAVAALAVMAGLTPSAQAVPMCTTTQTVSSGEAVPASILLTPGACVAAGDKIFGAFLRSGAITGDGSSSFTFQMTPGNVTIGFSGVVGPNQIGSLTYSVGVDPALAQGFLIDALEKDVTFNAVDSGLGASVTLSGGITDPFVVAFNCDRTVNPSGGSCPETHFFAPVTDITVSETLITGPNAIATALTDTISQVPPSPVHEPATLALLSTGLLGLGLYRFAQRRPH